MTLDIYFPSAHVARDTRFRGAALVGEEKL
jgi:hypothetical protein